MQWKINPFSLWEAKAVVALSSQKKTTQIVSFSVSKVEEEVECNADADD